MLSLQSREPGDADDATRRELIGRLAGELGSAFPAPSALTLQPYGSFLSCCYSRSSDLDLALSGSVAVDVLRPDNASEAEALSRLAGATGAVPLVRRLGACMDPRREAGYGRGHCGMRDRARSHVRGGCVGGAGGEEGPACPPDPLPPGVQGVCQGGMFTKTAVLPLGASLFPTRARQRAGQGGGGVGRDGGGRAGWEVRVQPTAKLIPADSECPT